MSRASTTSTTATPAQLLGWLDWGAEAVVSTGNPSRAQLFAYASRPEQAGRARDGTTYWVEEMLRTQKAQVRDVIPWGASHSECEHWERRHASRARILESLAASHAQCLIEAARYEVPSVQSRRSRAAEIAIGSAIIIVAPDETLELAGAA